MSRGTYISRPTRPSSTVSSSSSSSSASLRGCSPTPDFPGIQKLVHTVLRSSRFTVQQAVRLQSRLHQVYLAKLANGSSLVLKCPPTNNTRLLRHEKNIMESECKTLETLYEYIQLPVPQVIEYDDDGGLFGSPFLLMTYIPGRKLSELSSHLSVAERNTIDQSLGAYVRSITTLSAKQFGMTHRVFDLKGSKSWRETFLALLEAALRDAEDMLVTLPYDSIRYYVGRHSYILDDVTEPRLVAMNVCNPENILIDEHTKRVTGLVGFSNVLWGDELMNGGLSNGSEAFFEGFGECPARTGSVKARQLMYTIYRTTLEIVAYHYRPHTSINELEMRRELTDALNVLAQM